MAGIVTKIGISAYPEKENMNREIIKEEVKWLFEAITEQYQTISEYGDRIPQIEFDILMDNVRKFYQDMHLLQRLGEFPPAVETRPVTPKPEEKKEVAPPVPVPPPAAPEADSGTLQTGGLTVTFSDPPVTEEMASPADPVTREGFAPAPFRPSVDPAQRPAPAKLPQASTPDLFGEEEPVFNIRLKSAREQSLGPKTPSGRIDNLKAAISINDKFMFINELFDGNLREYNETIETLNGMKTLDQASEFLDLMRKKNFWNTGSAAFRKLQELVERRF